MNEKVELCKKIEKVVGYLPVGIGDILSILTHPDVINETEKYINAARSRT